MKKIVSNIKLAVKKGGQRLAIGIACIGLVFGLTAATVIGVLPGGGTAVLNSTSNSTNIVVFPLWPNSIAASTSVTNVTRIDVSAGANCAFQFTASATTTNGGIVIAQLGRNVQGGSPTNAAGTGLNIEWFATITNTLPANTATTPNTQCSLFGPVLGQGGVGEGGITTYYVGWITTPANVILTNYSVYAGTK